MNNVPHRPEGPHGPALNFLDGDSEMARLIRGKDWAATPLGPVEHWPQSLRTTVSLCLASNFPINIVWGPHATQIYNDGYRVLCGERHPATLGMDYTQCWASAWPAIGQPFERARSGATSYLENQRMFLLRNGYLEETFFTFSLSPIRDESGGIGGLFHPVTETTATMLGERRTRAVRDLTANLAEAQSTDEVYKRIAASLSLYELDLPFLLVYRQLEQGKYCLEAAAGLPTGTPLSAQELALDQPGPWRSLQSVDDGRTLRVDQIRRALDGIACGPYEEGPDTALAKYLPKAGKQSILVLAGLSARLPVTDAYQGFFDLLAAAIAAALARVATLEAERERIEMLGAIDRAKTAFFSNVSHEFRTPLTLILAPLEEALDLADTSGSQQPGLEIAYRNTRRLLKLVNCLLDFSRVEAGRTEARFEATDLAQLTREVASNFHTVCQRAGLALVIDCAILTSPVFVDRDMWEKIVLNLVSNAFKFTFSGAITVTLRDRGEGCELLVTDTGVGIAAHELPRVFDRFYRIDGQRGRSIEGSGIGLALVRELTSLHGGAIAAHSTQGAGSTFSVTLPYGSAHLPAQQVLADASQQTYTALAHSFLDEAMGWLSHSEAPATPAPSRSGRPTILLVEDNADMRAYIARLLARDLYDIVPVSDGAAALRALAEGLLPDLVLSDVMMPSLDGFGLLDALRSSPVTRDVVVILLSARAGEEARIEGLAAGADDYLVKPFSGRELRARVDGALALSRQRKESGGRERSLLDDIGIERDRLILREAQATLDWLFAQNAAGIAAFDNAGRLTRVNERYCQILERPKTALMNCHIFDYLDAAQLAENQHLLERALAQCVAFDIRSKYLKPDGVPTWVSHAVTPIRVHASAPVSCLMAVLQEAATPRM